MAALEVVSLMESRAAALRHWERCFLDGTVDDEHGEFIAGILAAAGKKSSMPDKAIQYLKAYLADLQHWSTGDDISSANFVTCGTPQMDSIEELKGGFYRCLNTAMHLILRLKLYLTERTVMTSPLKWSLKRLSAD
jgi:hypothetical protein